MLVGSSGADLLIGGDGADQFQYHTADIGLDRILDFTSGSDRIVLVDFLHTAEFRLAQSDAPVATSLLSTFLYNTSNGIVSFDGDGSGAGAPMDIAQLNLGLILTVDDFIFEDSVHASAADLDTAMATSQAGGSTGAASTGADAARYLFAPIDV